MSQLRKGRLPDGTRDIEVTGYGDVGRTSFTRGAVSGGAIVTTPSWRDRLNQQTREYKQREAEKARERRAR